MQSERKARLELEEYRSGKRTPGGGKAPLTAATGSASKSGSAGGDDESRRRYAKKLEDSCTELQKQLHIQKQDEEALMNEMDVTSAAFEDMQEQNARLITQLHEKDDANFRLMAERSRAQQLQKLVHEERDALTEQISDLQAQLDAQNLVVRKLEEKEAILQSSIATIEKELTLRQQGIELHKRKATEASQAACDLRLHVDKYRTQLNEAHTAVAEKTAALEREIFKHKRVQEEVQQLRRTVERLRKIEAASSADEVLMEEIREYKEQLTCPSCKVKKKDCVLTKCLHVFCTECIKTRYETRQRKCPKCNAGFGANDFRKIYLS